MIACPARSSAPSYARLTVLPAIRAVGPSPVHCAPDEAAVARPASGRVHVLRHHGHTPDPAFPAHNGIRWGSSPQPRQTASVHGPGSLPAGSPHPRATSEHCATVRHTSESDSAVLLFAVSTRR